MTGFNHGTTGALIALTVKKPELAIPLAFASHFVQDTIPHSDYFAGKKDERIFSKAFNRMLVFDFSASVTLMIILGVAFPSHKWLIWACMVAAACPDAMQSYYFWYLERVKNRKPNFDPISRIHYKIQNESRAGGLVEIAWAIVGLIIIFNLR